LITSSEEKEEVEKKKKSKRASKDKIRTASKAYCAACTIPEETSNLADPSVVCKKCSKDKEEVSEKQVKMSLKWWVLSNEEVAYLDEMYPHGESSILHPVLQCSHCETVSFPGTEAGLVEMKGPWMISKGGQRMTERDYRAVSKHIVSLCEGTPLKQTKCLLRPEHINLLVAGIKNSPEVQESQVEAFGYIKESNMASRMMSSDPVKAPYGLMPLPLAPTATEEDTTETRGFFNFLGRLMAQALLDQRLLNIPLSRTFIRAIRGEQFVHENVEASLPYVMEMDPTVGRSLSYLKELHVSYKDANSDKHAFESELNDMCLYFTLIGYSSIELIPNGKEIQVTIENVELFLTKTLEFLLESSFSIQLKAFQQGFNAIWHTDVLKLYDVDELEVLFADSCSTLWDVEGNALRTNMICDHGFTKESKTIHDLIEVLCEMAPEEQRLFIGFVTGANRLPVGGLSKLDPKLTVVRKLASDAETMDDDMLPSASTCTNYLKLPAYSTKKVLKERLLYCIREGQYAFHLS
jgi:E3 ubiquitin-protein ligase TRIP12